MKKTMFDWKEIARDSAKIISESTLKNKTEISTISVLYKKLAEKYVTKGKKIPKLNTYRQYMHKALKIPPKQKNVAGILYQLAGKYEKMTLKMLVENVDISATNGCKWLIVRLKRNDSDYTDTPKHLKQLSLELKKKFSQEIIFISFDEDTLVIMCQNGEAKNKIMTYFKENIYV